MQTVQRRNVGNGLFRPIRAPLLPEWIRKLALSKDHLHRVALSETVADCRGTDSKYLGPIIRRLGNTVVRDRNKGPLADTLIPSLFFRCCPTTIPRLVVAVIVNAIELVLWRRTRSHVLKKRFVTIAPAFTDLDAAPAISRKAWVVGILASRNHAGPRHIFGSTPCRARVSMLARETSRPWIV